MVASALRDVWRELRATGLDTPALRAVRVERPWLTLAQWVGCYQPGGAGMIAVPAVSLGRVHEYRRCAPWTSVRDILRHEYAHALADHHPAVVERAEFEHVFGGPYDAEHGADAYARDAHVSTYAASMPGEDFAETVMLYLRVQGVIEPFRCRPALHRKLRYVARIPRWLHSMNAAGRRAPPQRATRAR
jgi:hypothetical protein